MSEKYSAIHYHAYLDLDKVLDAQHPRSGDFEETAAHDEMLFIIVHQVYELWFKQIIHELNSVIDVFDDPVVEDKKMGIVIHRLSRIKTIQLTF